MQSNFFRQISHKASERIDELINHSDSVMAITSDKFVAPGAEASQATTSNQCSWRFAIIKAEGLFCSRRPTATTTTTQLEALRWLQEGRCTSLTPNVVVAVAPASQPVDGWPITN